MITGLLTTARNSMSIKAEILRTRWKVSEPGLSAHTWHLPLHEPEAHATLCEKSHSGTIPERILNMPGLTSFFLI